MHEVSVSSPLCLTNTLTRRKDPFKCREVNKVKMFTCGPSIYSRPHIGNYRTFLFEDILLRYLEYLDYDVERVINFTDIEDKAIAGAREKGVTLKDLTTLVAEQFFKGADLLKIKLPDYIPRSSTSVDQAVHLINILLEKGYAYRHGHDIFYDPLKFKGFGKLFGLDMSRWPKRKKRFRKDTYPGQRWNLGDFILWHGHKEGAGNVWWETEIGKGRPAWNIQDPAIITKHLGYQVDICCGGADNLYRHHDYTIAIIEAISGEELAKYWLHGEHVLIGGSKMSKSRGNAVYPESILEKGYQAGHLRFYLIYEHYRQKLDLTMEGLRVSSDKLDSLRDTVRGVTEAGSRTGESDKSVAELIDSLLTTFERHMNDDLDVKGACDGIQTQLARLIALKTDGRLGAGDCARIREVLHRIDGVFQIIY